METGIVLTFFFQFEAAYFSRDNLALHGFARFFAEQSKEESEHADNLIKYQNKRGGRVVFQDIAKPYTDDWNTPLCTLEASLELEKGVNESLLKLHKVAGSHNDPHLCDYLEEHFLSEQVDSLKKLADLKTKILRVGNDGVGLVVVDQELLSS